MAVAGQLVGDVDYLANGNVDKVTQVLGGIGSTRQVVTDFTYDADGNLTNINNPAPLGDVTIVPDALSRTNRVTDGKGQLTDYDYSAPFDPIANIDVAGGTAGVPEYVVDYDDDGNLTQLTDPNGTVTYSIDKVNRNLASRTSGAENIAYDYDKNGNLLKVSDANGDTVYEYDEVNRLKSLTEPGATNKVTFGYNNDNQRTKMTYPTSPQTSVDYTYDGSGRLKTINATKAGGPVGGVYSAAYDYAKAGADTGLVQQMSDPAGTTTYGYGSFGRLTSATGAVNRTYDNDIAGNMLSSTEGATTTFFDYGNANQLCSTGPTAPTGTRNAGGCLPTPAGATSYSYDGNGNLTASAGGTNGGWAFSYNSTNQTTATTHDGGTLDNHTYRGPAQAERLQAGTNTYTTTQLGVTSQTGSAGNTTGFIRDTTGNLISRRVPGTGTSHYYLTDGLGSVVGLVDGSGNKTNTYRYDPYGKPLATTEGVSSPWRFHGGYQDTPTGLTKLGHRYYDPDIARFTQRDPSGADLPYSYAGCNPTTNADPTGLMLDFGGPTTSSGSDGGNSDNDTLTQAPSPEPTTTASATPTLNAGFTPIPWFRAAWKFIPPIGFTCYVYEASLDVSSSISDELAQLSGCFNPLDFAMNDLSFWPRDEE